MKFFDRTLLAVMLPAIAWGFLGLLKLHFWRNNYGASIGPSSDEVLFGQILLIEGGLLCLVALVPPFRAWREKRLNRVLIGSVIASATFLVFWFPAGIEGLMRRTGVLA